MCLLVFLLCAIIESFVDFSRHHFVASSRHISMKNINCQWIELAFRTQRLNFWWCCLLKAAFVVLSSTRMLLKAAVKYNKQLKRFSTASFLELKPGKWRLSSGFSTKFVYHTYAWIYDVSSKAQTHIHWLRKRVPSITNKRQQQYHNCIDLSHSIAQMNDTRYDLFVKHKPTHAHVQRFINH